MPDAGFEDRARTGTLIAAVRDGEPIGYALYDLPRNEVRLRQLCVQSAARRGGIAQLLVDEICRRHPERVGIRVRCRSDYPAHEAWPGLGFTPLNEAPGRSQHGHPLTDWSLRFAHPDLLSFSPEADARPAVAVDANVFYDWHQDRPDCVESRILLQDWVADEVELVVTDELEHDIARSGSAETRRESRRHLERVRHVRPTDDEWRPVFESLRARRGTATQPTDSDFGHVARAVAGGAEYLVTRDEKLLAFADAIGECAVITVLRPSRLASALDEARRSDAYQPAQLQGTAFQTAPALEYDEDELVRAFINSSEGEKRGGFLSPLRSLAARSAVDARAVRAGDGQLVGIFVREATNLGSEVSLLRVKPGPRSATIARQLLSLQRQRQLAVGGGTIELTDPHPSKQVREALPLESFSPTTNGWQCQVIPAMTDYECLTRGDHGAVDLSESIGARDPCIGRAEAAALERRFWPLRVLSSDLPSFLIPIRRQWAEDLFDTNLSSETLFDRPTRLGMSCEHVYYRKPANANGLAAPARLLWFVASSKIPRWRPGEIRAVSLLDELVVERPRTLFRRFEHLGVYDLAQVEHAAGRHGIVMGLRFSHTELLSRPIPVSQLRELAFASMGIKHPPLQSPWPINEHMFVNAYREGTGRD